jgi:hypothetical protein
LGAFFCPRFTRTKKPGFPLQVLGKRRCAFLWAFRSNPSRRPAADSSLKTKFTAKSKTGKGEEAKKGSKDEKKLKKVPGTFFSGA